VSVDDAEGVGTNELVDGCEYGLFEVLCFCVVDLDKMGDDFRICVGGEGDVLVAELFF